MPYRKCFKVRIYLQSLWAVGFLVMGTLWLSCKKPMPKAASSEQGECRELTEQPFARFKKIFPGCVKSKPQNGSHLYAHFLETTLKDDLCFEDVLDNKIGSFHCAPGPFLIENQTVIDVEENAWKLSRVPDYFVWHLENTLEEDSFYITNQQGFPIKSQAIRLQHGKEATIILLPKGALLPGVKYYIYMVMTSNNSRQTWIQPLATTAKASF